MRNAKIVCTLGPATDTQRAVRELADAGMSVARVNASHGTPDERAALVENVRRVDETTPEPVAVMVDLQGPEVRTAPVEEPVHLAEGSTVTFEPGESATPEQVGVSASLAAVEPGDRVLLDDGRIETVVEAVDGDAVRTRVATGGDLGARKGVNVPGVDLGLDAVTEKDRRDLAFAAEHEVDFVAASFVRSAADVLAVGEVLEEEGAEVPIIAKIERADAIENLAGILDTAYGVMVARGDLGVELPMEDVPMMQKRIVRRCHEAGVPVITATEMLDSMIHSRRPTRAEASDVANAVLDGTDAVMLSAETAVGDHPVRVVETMDSIIREVEASAEHAEQLEGRVPTSADSRTDALARSARYLARDVDAAAVVVASESGYTALKTAKYRPAVPVVATTPNDRVRRQLALSWGVNAQYADLGDGDASEVVEAAARAAVDAGVAESGDTVVVLSGMMTELEGADTTNTLKVHVVAETLAVGRGVVHGWVSGPVARLATGDLDDVPDGAIAVLESGFDDDFRGDLSRLAGIVTAQPGMTSYPAMVARELDVPLVAGAELGERVADGDPVTLDAERGVVYGGEIEGRRGRAGRDDRSPGAGKR